MGRVNDQRAAKIREYLDGVDEAFGDDETGANDALREVLVYLESVKSIDDAHRVGAEFVAHGVHYTIARELGVLDEY